ncbi:uncharacterized protein LOC142765308 isoform X7 [Rhipicephalus microplus]|uniref:uncharacterized protein LOC142765308 isoform X7 n=1 Tax=Rhipicephalus microplus TaxID=6941 RepID=UPI003F6C91F0
MSLTASPEKALDPSNLSAAAVELPGTCSPLGTHLLPAAVEGTSTPSRMPGEPAFREEKGEAKIARSKEGGGATSSKKSKNSKHLQKDTADLSAKDERELAEPYSPPIVMSLAASPEKALDPSNLSAATVELPGTCSPLRTHPTPAAAHPHPPGCQVNQLLGKRKARQGSSCPYFWPWPL